MNKMLHARRNTGVRKGFALMVVMLACMWAVFVTDSVSGRCTQDGPGTRVLGLRPHDACRIEPPRSLSVCTVGNHCQQPTCVTLCSKEIDIRRDGNTFYRYPGYRYVLSTWPAQEPMGLIGVSARSPL